MNLRDFALLTDENISPSVVSFLRTNEFDVLDVKESGLIGTNDVDLIRLSFEKERVLVTHDQDFGALAVMDRETPEMWWSSAQADPVTAFEGGAVTLSPSVEGGAEPLTYRWDQNGGPTVVIDNDTSAQAGVAAMISRSCLCAKE